MMQNRCHIVIHARIFPIGYNNFIGLVSRRSRWPLDNQWGRIVTSSRWRIIGPFVGLGVFFGLLGLLMAVSLLSQQAKFSRVLRDRVAGQHAAVELEECVCDVIALLKDRAESVESLHLRLDRHLSALRLHADEPDEIDLTTQIENSLDEYRRLWSQLPPSTQPERELAVEHIIRFLERQLVKPCQEFESFNTRLIESAASDHQSALRWLAWGMAGIAALAMAMGTLIGYGITRAMRRTIGRLAVQIQDAAGKMGDAPRIVITEGSDVQELHAQVDRLSIRIETVVQELQQRQREVLRAEQLAAVGQLAAGVAHEIRNPLTSIKMLVQAGLEDGVLPAEDLRVIEPEVRRMERSLQTFLDFARPPKPERRRTGLNDIVRHVIGLIQGRAAKQRVQLTTMLPDEEVWLIADAQQLQQVLINLALNSLDEMPHGGGIQFAVHTFQNEAIIQVADDGPGLSREIASRLFEPFASSKSTGMGLGLVISRRIVEDHGGTITAANRSQVGALMTVRLPGCLEPQCPPC